MNRSHYFAYIEEKLNVLAYRINQRGKLNILDLHVHSENFYAYFLNELYEWKLGNLNRHSQNIEAIDLIDHDNKIVIQVSATSTKQKIEQGLAKDILKQYATYRYLFISISKEASKLRKESFFNPHGISFSPQEDIIDIQGILSYIVGLDIDDQKRIYDFIAKELGNIDIVKLDSNLAAIINILAKEEWTNQNNEHAIIPFEISEKIHYNKLKVTKRIIEEYKIYHHKIENKYEMFDELGSNKSYSVLQQIGRFYIEESVKSDDPDTIFFNVCERMIEKVKESANFANIESEMLILCVDILAVDAFIRCKIFENPNT